MSYLPGTLTESVSTAVMALSSLYEIANSYPELTRELGQDGRTKVALPLNSLNEVFAFFNL